MTLFTSDIFVLSSSIKLVQPSSIWRVQVACRSCAYYTKIKNVESILHNDHIVLTNQIWIGYSLDLTIWKFIGFLSENCGIFAGVREKSQCLLNSLSVQLFAMKSNWIRSRAGTNIVNDEIPAHFQQNKVVVYLSGELSIFFCDLLVS